MRYTPLLTLVVWTGGIALGAGQLVRSPEPRIQPLSEDDGAWSDYVNQGIETFGVDASSASNFLKTLAQHPPALYGIGPLAEYIRRDSMVTAVDQTLMGLRAAWLCGSQVLWAELAAEGRTLGLSDSDFRRIAEGPDAGLGAWDATLVRATDELYRDSFLSDNSWDMLATRYNIQQLIDVIFTGAEYIMLSMMANSFGVQPDEGFTDRLPVDVPRTIVLARATPVRLTAARLTPIPRNEWDDETRQLLDPNDTQGPTLNLYATLARHPRFYRPRAVQSAYIRTQATLSERVREILILRIGWLCGAEYEWAQHVRAARRIGMTDEEVSRITIGADAPGWDPFEASLIRATDELHRDDMISDSTWNTLAERYSTSELIDVVITVAGYRMVSMALNSIGTQLEPDRDGFPDL